MVKKKSVRKKANSKKKLYLEQKASKQSKQEHDWQKKRVESFVNTLFIVYAALLAVPLLILTATSTDTSPIMVVVWAVVIIGGPVLIYKTVLFMVRKGSR